jgi:hypothetical protein
MILGEEIAKENTSFRGDAKRRTRNPATIAELDRRIPGSRLRRAPE